MPKFATQSATPVNPGCLLIGRPIPSFEPVNDPFALVTQPTCFHRPPGTLRKTLLFKFNKTHHIPNHPPGVADGSRMKSNLNVEAHLVDLVGIEPTTSSMPWKRAPSCATGPQEGLSYFHGAGTIRQSNGSARPHTLVRRNRYPRRALATTRCNQASSWSYVIDPPDPCADPRDAFMLRFRAERWDANSPSQLGVRLAASRPGTGRAVPV